MDTAHRKKHTNTDSKKLLPLFYPEHFISVNETIKYYEKSFKHAKTGEKKMFKTLK